jgi:hypothetical protein
MSVLLLTEAKMGRAGCSSNRRMRMSAMPKDFTSEGKSLGVAETFVLVPAELGRFALEGVTIVADAMDHVANLVRRHAVAAGESGHFVILVAGDTSAVGAAHQILVVGHCLPPFLQ